MAKANSGSLWLIAASYPLSPFLGEVTHVTIVGYKNPGVPYSCQTGTRQALHSTHWNRSNVLLRMLRLASFGEGPGLAPFNSQILAGCCNYL